MSIGHHACEHDYARLAEPHQTDADGHDADESRYARDRVEDWPDELLDTYRALAITLARGDGSGLSAEETRIRSEVCLACRGSGLGPKSSHVRRSGCGACRGTGAKPDTTLRRVVNELSLRYPRGGQTPEWRAPGTERRGVA